MTYEVGLEVPPYRVIGTVMLYPGYEPARLLERSNDMFVAVINATASMGAQTVSQPGTDVILVNRQYMRGVEQIDARTGERYEKLPGGSLGVGSALTLGALGYVIARRRENGIRARKRST